MRSLYPLSLAERRQWVFLFALCMLPVAVYAFAVTFTTRVVGDANYDQAKDVRPFDLDEDGDIDFLAVSDGKNDVSWFRNNGSQSFTEVTIDASFTDPYSVIGANIDNAGGLDVVACSADSGDRLKWYANNGSESFTTNDIGAVADCASVYAADIDGDGDQDLVVGEYSEGDVDWYENDGSGSFTKIAIDSGLIAVWDVFVVDIDDDGDKDILVADFGAYDVLLFTNNGVNNPTFTKTTIDNNLDQTHSVYAVDLDEDGDIDILATGRLADDVNWYSNNGSETFTKYTIDGSLDGASDVTVGDIDGDGDRDVLAVGQFANDVIWYDNNGSESFTSRTVDADFESAYKSIVYDVDLDGTNDLVVTGNNNNTDNITWFENLGDATAPTISSVSSDTAAGSYNAGDVIDIDVTFSEAVTSTGNVTVTLETGDTDRTCTFTVTNASSGTCSYTVQAGDTSADLTVSSISGTIADQASNPMSNFVPTTNLAANEALVIDTTSPSAPGTPDLATASDSGSSSSDDTTTDTTPTFSVSCETGAIVTLSGASLTATGTCASSTVSITMGAIGTDGTYLFKAYQTDAAGNVSTRSSGISVTLDTAAPSAPGTPDLATASDAGDSTSDDLTNDTTPTFAVSCETGTTVTLSGATLTATGTCASSTVSITMGAIGTDGTYLFKAYQTDAAGNVSTRSSGISVTLDSAEPTLAEVTPVTTPTTDTTPDYVFSTDEDGTISYGGSCTSVTTAATSGNNTVTFSVLAAGTYGSCTVIVTDAAGNASAALAVTSFTVTVASSGSSSSSHAEMMSGGGGARGAGSGVRNAISGIMGRLRNAAPSGNASESRGVSSQNAREGAGAVGGPDKNVQGNWSHIHPRIIERVQKKMQENPKRETFLRGFLDRLAKRMLSLR